MRGPVGAGSPRSNDSRKRSASVELVASVGDGATWLRHPYSRMAWRKMGDAALLFANGAAFPASVADARLIAGMEQVDEEAAAALTGKGRALLQQLADAGHYQPVEDDEEA